MSEFPSLPLFTDAFIADTGHLNATETGAYLMLLMMAWRSPGCRLPDDDQKLARWARVDPRAWARIKRSVMEFWTLVDGYWTQKRLVLERDKVCKSAERARVNGMRGGRPKPLENLDVANPVGSVWVTHKKASNPNPIKKESKLEAKASNLLLAGSESVSLASPEKPSPKKPVLSDWPADYREQVWQAYGQRREKKVSMAALDKLKASGALPWQDLIQAIHRQAESVEPQFRPSLERWIKREKWTDEHPPPANGRPVNGHPVNCEDVLAVLARRQAERGLTP